MKLGYCAVYIWTEIKLVFVHQDEQVNQLKRPKHFPNPNTIYSLRELTIVWHLYGGKDFSLPSPLPSSSSYKQRKHKTTFGMSEVSEERKLSSQKDWKRKGGPGRNHDVLMEIELNKV